MNVRLCLLPVAAGLAIAAFAQSHTPIAYGGMTTSRALNFGKLPLSFEANEGQTDPKVRFLSRGSGYSIFLTDAAAVLRLENQSHERRPESGRQTLHRKAQAGTADVIRMELSGAAKGIPAVGVERLAGTANYFVGRTPAEWRTDVPTYGKVAFAGVYPGVDLVYYGNQQQLEYDFVVAAGADPAPIRMHFAGARSLQLGADGALKVIAANGKIAFHKPVLYQDMNGQRSPVAGGYRLLADNTIGFALGSYDRSRPLVIDPTLSFSTYLAGSLGSYPTGLAVDTAGYVYVTGTTDSPDFPTTVGAFSSDFADQLTFVSKLNKTGTALVYSTFLGGTSIQATAANGIAVDASGSAFVAGYTTAADYPVTPGAYQKTNPGDTPHLRGGLGGFITRLNPAGSGLVYSTFFGGPSADSPIDALALNAADEVTVGGQTDSNAFPVTAGALQTKTSAANTGFLARFNNSGSGLVFSTYLPGSAGSPLAVDAAGDSYIAGGSTGFPVTPGAFQQQPQSGTQGPGIMKVNSTGTKVVYGTYLGGGEGPQGGDTIYAIAVDASGSAYVAGSTSSGIFPVTPGAFQLTNNSQLYQGICCVGTGFVTKLNSTASALEYSTYLGGEIQDRASSISVDAAGHAFVTGQTYSEGFPITPNAYQLGNHGEGGTGNAFLTEMNADGTGLIYSTFLGGTGSGNYVGDFGTAVSLNAAGNVYIAGAAQSLDFPVTQGAFQSENPDDVDSAGSTFVARFIFPLSLVGTTTKLTASANPQKPGTSVTFTAFVQRVGQSGIPTGSITGSINGQAVIKMPLDRTGHASYTTTALGDGSYSLKAAYSGDSTDAASSGLLTEVIAGSSSASPIAAGTDIGTTTAVETAQP